MGLALKAAVTGRVATQMQDRVERIERGATEGMRAAVNLGKTRMRADVRQAGFDGGERLSKTWQGEVFPDRGASLNASGLLYSKAPAIIAAHEEGATIRPVGRSRDLWIPTDNVPRQGRGGKRMSPGMVEERFTDFDYVPSSKPGVFLAVVEAVRRTTSRGRTGFRRFSQGRARRGDVADSVHMFTLVPVARLPKRLKGRSIRDDVAANALPRLVSQALALSLREPR